MSFNEELLESFGSGVTLDNTLEKTIQPEQLEHGSLLKFLAYRRARYYVDIIA